MRKLLKTVGFLSVVAVVLYMGTVVRDKVQLRENVLRLHVVANSDSDEDQAVKLKVRDAILNEVEAITATAGSKEEARELLRVNLSVLEQAANTVLEAEGSGQQAGITLEREEFPRRQYDTFTLPAGVYDSLRVTIGEGTGRNWWCVVFPSLCIPAASDTVADTAVSAGFSDSLSGAITEEPVYEVRFFLLDCIGWLENFFCKG